MEEPAHFLESPRVLWGVAALTIAAAVLAVREVTVRVLRVPIPPLSSDNPLGALSSRRECAWIIPPQSASEDRGPSAVN